MGRETKPKPPLPVSKLVLDGEETEVQYPGTLPDDWLGSYNRGTQVIQVLGTLPSNVAFCVLVHEIFHHVYQQSKLSIFFQAMGLKGEELDETEELFVDSLSGEFVKVLQANRGMFKKLAPIWNEITSRKISSKGTFSMRNLLGSSVKSSIVGLKPLKSSVI